MWQGCSTTRLESHTTKCRLLSEYLARTQAGIRNDYDSGSIFIAPTAFDKRRTVVKTLVVQRRDPPIGFIQPAYARYQRPLFDRFRSYYDTTFYFMREPRLKARRAYFLRDLDILISICATHETKKASYYRTADVVVLPSVAGADGRRGQESWGLVVNEAMSMGKPILTTDAVGAAPDLVKDGINGFVVRNGDVDALYSGLKTILDNRQLRKEMGKSSRMIFEEFNDFDKMFEGFRQAIAYVTGGDRSGMSGRKTGPAVAECLQSPKLLNFAGLLGE